MNKHQQRGFTTTMYIFIGVMIVIFGLGWLVHLERNQLLEKNKELANEIATNKETIQNLNDTNGKLSAENKALSKTAELVEKISKDINAERVKREESMRTMDEKLKVLNNKMPGVLSDDKVCKPTEDELRNSAQRIDYIWSVFTLNYHLQVVK